MKMLKFLLTVFALSATFAANAQLAEFKNKWCKSIDKSTMSPVDYRGIRAGDGCLLPDAVILGALKEFQEKKIDVMNLKAIIGPQLENVELGEFKFPLLRFIFFPKNNKFYVVIFDALICPPSELNSLTESNSFRVALENKYGKPSAVYTDYDRIKIQVDELEKMIAEQKKKAITVAEAKAARDGEQQLGILKNLLKSMNQKIPVQLNWEYDSKNRVVGETGLIIAKVDNKEMSANIRCGDEVASAFMIQIIGTSSYLAMRDKLVNEARQNEVNKEKSAPTPQF